MGLSDHSVLMDVPPNFPKIFADPDRLRQVLSNLVTNAVKYSPNGGSITVRCRERGPQHVVIAVVDHGLGIPPEQVAKLFQKFSRVRAEEHNKISGTGLGLYICRLIVEGHGGQIWVESEYGKGSTFAMALPHDARIARRQVSEEDQMQDSPTALPGLPRPRRLPHRRREDRLLARLQQALDVGQPGLDLHRRVAMRAAAERESSSPRPGP